jgi:hypothetical protein
LLRPWPWLDIVRPPVKHTLPDVLSVEELARIVLGTRERHYQTFWTTYSMCLRLNEALTLRVGDIDASRGLVHMRAGMDETTTCCVIASSYRPRLPLVACVAFGEITKKP